MTTLPKSETRPDGRPAIDVLQPTEVQTATFALG